MPDPLNPNPLTPNKPFSNDPLVVGRLNDPLANQKSYADYSNTDPNAARPGPGRLDADLARDNYNRRPTADVSPESARIAGQVPAADQEALKANREAQAKTRRDAFALEQKSRAEVFEREQTGREQVLERQETEAAVLADHNAKIAQARAENDQAAFNAGLITHDDLLNRHTMLAGYEGHGVMMPHEALSDGEATVKMAFPRNVVLTQSAGDVRRLTGDTTGVREEGVGEDPASTNRDLSVMGAIVNAGRVLFYKGYHDVPVSFADHKWLADNGAYRLGGDGKPETPEARNDRVKKVRGDRKTERRDHRVNTDDDTTRPARVRAAQLKADDKADDELG